MNNTQNNNTMTNAKAKDLKKRMKHVIEDAGAVLSHLMDDKSLDELTDYGVKIHTHLDNITIACDLNDTESEAWKTKA